jgi:ankyrin repeat protein
MKLVHNINVKKIKIVKAMVENQDSDFNLLHSVCHDGNLELVKLMIDGGVDISTVDKYGWTPLHNACYDGNLELVKLLVDSDADISAVNKFGSTALHIACNNDNLEIAKFLVDRGADVSAVNKYGSTTLQSLDDEQLEEIERHINLNVWIKPAKR